MTWGEPCANEASSKQEGLNVRKFKVWEVVTFVIAFPA
jgi:hypothetical protein